VLITLLLLILGLYSFLSQNNTASCVATWREIGRTKLQLRLKPHDARISRALVDGHRIRCFELIIKSDRTCVKFSGIILSLTLERTTIISETERQIMTVVKARSYIRPWISW